MATGGEIASEEDIKIQHSRKQDAIWFHVTIAAVPLVVLLFGFVGTRRGRRRQE